MVGVIKTQPRQGASSNCDQRVVLKETSEGMRESYVEDNVENSRYICEPRYICGVNQEVNYMEERTKGPMNVKQL